VGSEALDELSIRTRGRAILSVQEDMHEKKLEVTIFCVPTIDEVVVGVAAEFHRGKAGCAADQRVADLVASSSQYALIVFLLHIPSHPPPTPHPVNPDLHVRRSVRYVPFCSSCKLQHFSS